MIIVRSELSSVAICNMRNSVSHVTTAVFNFSGNISVVKHKFMRCDSRDDMLGGSLFKIELDMGSTLFLLSSRLPSIFWMVCHVRGWKKQLLEDSNCIKQVGSKSLAGKDLSNVGPIVVKNSFD